MIKKIKASKKELFYNEFSEEWESKINNLETQKRIKVVFGKLFNTNDLKGRNFLEVGCGLGYFSEKAFKMGAKVTGIDVGGKLVQKTKQRVPKGNFFVVSASKLPFKDNVFDTVLSTEVIEHVDMQQKAISEMCRVLRKGGILVITTPNKIFKPLFDLMSLINIRPYHGNEKWLYPWHLKKMLLGKGLIVESEYFFNFIFPNKLLDNAEKLPILKYFMINYGFKLRKI